jgi:hypothetical protein
MQQPAGAPMQYELRTRLNDAHGLLLSIHKALLDHERNGYEKKHGHIETPGALLQLVINDPWFDWLKPLSALITQIDDFTAGKEPIDLDEGKALLDQSRRVVAPNEAGSAFQREYLRTIQESPEVASLHGQWKRLLQSFNAVT